MNILIPMAGLGSRFLTKGFTIPKPLIDVNGTPMIIKAIKSLGIVDANYLFVIAKNSHTELVKEQISKAVPSQFIEIDYITEGPACSALLFESIIDTDEELIIANCDQIMEWNSTLFLMNSREYDGTVVTYHETTDKNSYAKVNDKGYVTEIREKQTISNISLNGIHYWKHGKTFVKSAKEMIAADDRAPNGEFYVGPTYNYMIKDGLSVGIYHIPNQMHHAVGIPEDLERYIEHENSKVR
jgi:NDP-sugar pyrophosphorylase family protein